MSERRSDAYVGADQWVKAVGTYADGSTMYQAGAKSKAYNEGEIVSKQYAQNVLASIEFRNKAYGTLSRIQKKDLDDLTDRQKEVLEGGYQEAQLVQSEFYKLSKEMNKAQERQEEARIEELEQEMTDLRSAMGSP